MTTFNAAVQCSLDEPIDTNGKNLTFGGEGVWQVQGAISGTGSLTRTNGGLVNLYASNSFAGPVQILQGGITIFNGSALGSTNGSTTISPGARLTLANSIMVPEPIVVGGTLISASSANSLTGPVTLPM